MRGMRGNKGLLVAGTLLVLGCGGPKRATVPGPQVGGQRVTVVEFTPVAATNYDAPTGSLGLALAEEIAGELRRQGHTAEAIPAGGQPTGDVIVRGRLVRVDGGSRAQCYWVGFGAGAAKFGTAGDVLKRDGTQLASFADERRSGFGIFGGATETLMQKCVRQVGRDIAEMVHTGEYRQ